MCRRYAAGSGRARAGDARGSAAAPGTRCVGSCRGRDRCGRVPCPCASRPTAWLPLTRRRPAPSRPRRQLRLAGGEGAEPPSTLWAGLLVARHGRDVLLVELAPGPVLDHPGEPGVDEGDEALA